MTTAGGPRIRLPIGPGGNSSSLLPTGKTFDRVGVVALETRDAKITSLQRTIRNLRQKINDLEARIPGGGGGGTTPVIYVGDRLGGGGGLTFGEGLGDGLGGGLLSSSNDLSATQAALNTARAELRTAQNELNDILSFVGDADNYIPSYQISQVLERDKQLLARTFQSTTAWSTDDYDYLVFSLHNLIGVNWLFQVNSIGEESVDEAGVPNGAGSEARARTVLKEQVAANLFNSSYQDDQWGRIPIADEIDNMTLEEMKVFADKQTQRQNFAILKVARNNPQDSEIRRVHLMESDADYNKLITDGGINLPPVDDLNSFDRRRYNLGVINMQANGSVLAKDDALYINSYIIYGPEAFISSYYRTAEMVQEPYPPGDEHFRGSAFWKVPKQRLEDLFSLSNTTAEIVPELLYSEKAVWGFAVVDWQSYHQNLTAPGIDHVRSLYTSQGAVPPLTEKQSVLFRQYITDDQLDTYLQKELEVAGGDDTLVIRSQWVNTGFLEEPSGPRFLLNVFASFVGSPPHGNPSKILTKKEDGWEIQDVYGNDFAGFKRLGAGDFISSRVNPLTFTPVVDWLSPTPRSVVVDVITGNTQLEWDFLHNAQAPALEFNSRRETGNLVPIGEQHLGYVSHFGGNSNQNDPAVLMLSGPPFGKQRIVKNRPIQSILCAITNLIWDRNVNYKEHYNAFRDYSGPFHKGSTPTTGGPRGDENSVISALADIGQGDTVYAVLTDGTLIKFEGALDGPQYKEPQDPIYWTVDGDAAVIGVLLGRGQTTEQAFGTKFLYEPLILSDRPAADSQLSLIFGQTRDQALTNGFVRGAYLTWNAIKSFPALSELTPVAPVTAAHLDILGGDATAIITNGFADFTVGTPDPETWNFTADDLAAALVPDPLLAAVLESYESEGVIGEQPFDSTQWRKIQLRYNDPNWSDRPVGAAPSQMVNDALLDFARRSTVAGAWMVPLTRLTYQWTQNGAEIYTSVAPPDGAAPPFTPVYGSQLDVLKTTAARLLELNMIALRPVVA